MSGHLVGEGTGVSRVALGLRRRNLCNSLAELSFSSSAAADFEIKASIAIRAGASIPVAKLR